MKPLLPGTAVLASLLLSAGCVMVDSQGHIVRDEKHFTVTGTPELHLTTIDGSIVVSSSDSAPNAVVVEIEKRGSSQQEVERLAVDTHQNGDRIDVEVRRTEKHFLFIGIGPLTPTARLIVTMPPNGNVTAKSGDGSIRVEHISGLLDLHSGDGSVRTTDAGGALHVSSGDGSVTLDNVSGDADVTTGDGSVSLSGALGRVKISTGDGSVTLHAAADTAMKSDWSITTGDGSVSLHLPQGFNADLDAHSGGGRVRNALGLTTKDSGDRHSLRGTLGTGGRTLSVHTGDGSIRVSGS